MQIAEGRKAVMCGCALILMLIIIPILNQHVFGVLDAKAPFARDVSVLAGAAAAIGIALTARHCPQLMKANALCTTALALFFVGCIGTNLGLLFNSAIAVYVFASMSSIVRSFVYILIGVALSRLAQNLSRKAIVHGFLCACAVSPAVFFIPQTVGVILSYAFVLAASLLVFPMAKSVFEHQAESDAPRDIAVTRPNTFLSFSAEVYVCIFLFALSLGYSLRLGAQDGTPLSFVVGFVLIGVLYAASKAAGKPFPADTLVRVSAIFVIAGFLSVLLVEQGVMQIPAAIILGGDSLFEMVTWIVLVSIASKNPLDAIPVIGWGRGMISIAVTIGAQFGNLANGLAQTNSAVITAATCLFVLAFCCYVFFVLQRFSFDEVIRELAPLTEERISLEVLDAQTPDHTWLINHRCGLIGEAKGLTPREVEIFIMLAKGRNSAFIQDKLVVSQNTVKTHVKHIYQKLDIHSHQELINYVENFQDSPTAK